MVGIKELLNIPAGVIETPEEEALLGLLRTTEMVHQHSRRTLFSDGISQAQFNILMILSHDAKAGISQNAIAGRLVTTKGNLSQHLAQMEADDLIRREPGAADRRLSIVTLTAKGRRQVARLEPRYREQIANVFRSMRRSDVAALIRGTDRLRDNLLAVHERGEAAV